MVVAFVSSIASPTSNCAPNLRHYSKAWNKTMLEVVLGGVYFMQLFQTFLSTQEVLGEGFKDTWFRVNPNSPINFMSYIKNEEK